MIDTSSQYNISYKNYQTDYKDVQTNLIPVYTSSNTLVFTTVDQPTKYLSISGELTLAKNKSTLTCNIHNFITTNGILTYEIKDKIWKFTRVMIPSVYMYNEPTDTTDAMDSLNTLTETLLQPDNDYPIYNGQNNLFHDDVINNRLVRSTGISSSKTKTTTVKTGTSSGDTFLIVFFVLVFVAILIAALYYLGPMAINYFKSK
jgi:hypothetical protein